MEKLSDISVYAEYDSFTEDVKKAVNGDTAAFSRLYELVYKDMYRTALYNLRSTHDASDVVSDTVIDAFQSIKKLKNEKAFRSWIMKILSAKIKRKQKEYMNNKTVEYDEYCNEYQDFNYEYHELKTALDSLDDESRMILSMSAINGFTSSEISKICKINSSTIRSKLARIKEKLRYSLECDE